MDDLKKVLTSITASLHVLSANTQHNTDALRLMTTRNRETEQAVRDLQGTFASIETHFVRLFEREDQQDRDIAELRRRVEVLERRRPPAA